MVTTGYGLRNVPDLTTAIDEMYRVLRRGGQVLSLDFNRPSNAARPVGVSRCILTLVGGMLGWVLHRDPDTYRYIPASIRTLSGRGGGRAADEARGVHDVRHYPVLGGLMAIHHARK